MVLSFDQEESGSLVRIVRDANGDLIGFQDPEQGSRFISRSEAVNRLLFNPSTGELVDSYGNTAGVGAIGIPGRGIRLTYAVKTATYKRLDTNVATFDPASNQEIVERVVFVDRNGKLVTLETSYGLGQKYDPNQTGGRWRQAASEALGAGSERLPTADLQRAVVYKEFIIKTIR